MHAKLTLQVIRLRAEPRHATRALSALLHLHSESKSATRLEYTAREAQGAEAELSDSIAAPRLVFGSVRFCSVRFDSIQLRCGLRCGASRERRRAGRADDSIRIDSILRFDSSRSRSRSRRRAARAKVCRRAARY